MIRGVSRPLACLAFCLALPAAVLAQKPDTVRRVTPAAPTIPTAPDDSVQAPIGGRRAFFYSFLVPGSAQTILGRHKAATAFLLVEAISLAMLRESAADVHEARRSSSDSIVTSYVDQSGNQVITKTAARFGPDEVKTRESHVEDWAALLVANHLFAGADAFVAANLWDVPTQLGLRVGPNGTALVASFKW